MEVWRRYLTPGSILLGEFRADALAGLGLYQREIAPGFANLAVLHVHAVHRGLGVGRLLIEEMIRRARADGMPAMICSAAPTKASVDFYLRRGFVVDLQNAPLEEGDIPLILAVREVP